MYSKRRNAGLITIASVLSLTVAGSFPVSAVGQEVVRLEGSALASAWLLPTENSVAASAYLIVPAGEAANDGPEGLAHYVEHLAWQAVRQAQDRSGAFDRHTNAWTSWNEIGYLLTGTADALPDMLHQLSAALDPLEIEPAVANSERDIILQEYTYRFAEVPAARLVADLRTRLFEDDARSRTLLGSPTTIQAFSLTEAEAYHAATHQPENAALIVQGGLATPAVRDMVIAAFGEAKGEVRPIDAPTAQPPDFIPPTPGRDVEQVHAPDLPGPLLLFHRIVYLPQEPPVPEPELVSLVVEQILNSSLPGGLNRPLRQERLARGLDIAMDLLDDRHIHLAITAQPDPGIDLETLLSGVEEALDAIAINGVPGETIDRILERMTGRLSGDHHVDGKMLAAAIHRLSQGRHPRDLTTTLALLNRISPADIDTVVTAFSEGSRTVATLAAPSN